MKKTGKCPKCESRNLLGNVEISDHGSKFPIQIYVYKSPKAQIFQKPVARPLLAWICTDCGYTELYTYDPQALMEAFHENRANS